MRKAPRENQPLFCPKSILHSQNSLMSAQLTSHTLTTYHQQSLFIIHTHTTTLARITSHTFTHISPTYHSNIHPCERQLPLTHSSMSVPLTYHTLTQSLTHSSMSAPLTYHTLTTYGSHTIYHSYTHPCQSQLPLTITHIRATYLHTLIIYHSHTHSHSSMAALLTSHILTTCHSHTHLC